MIPAEEISVHWNEMFRKLAQADCVDEFVVIMNAAAEAAGRMGISVYDNERQHALMVARQAICYELADGAKDALEALEAKAKVEEAERFRRELAKGS